MNDQEYLFFQDRSPSFSKQTDSYPTERWKFYNIRTPYKNEESKHNLLAYSENFDTLDKKAEKNFQPRDRKTDELSFLSYYGGSFSSSRGTTKSSHKLKKPEVTRNEESLNVSEDEDDYNDMLSLQWESSPKPKAASKSYREHYYPYKTSSKRILDEPTTFEPDEALTISTDLNRPRKSNIIKRKKRTRKAIIQLGPLSLKFPKKVGRTIKSSLSVAHHIFNNNYREGNNFMKKSDPYIDDESTSSVVSASKGEIFDRKVRNNSDQFYSERTTDEKNQNTTPGDTSTSYLEDRSVHSKKIRKNKIRVKVQTNIGQEMLYIESKVNNRVLHACIDTGASHTVMSLEAAAKCGLAKYMDTSVNGKVKGAGYANIVGVIDKAKLKIGPLLEVETRLTIIDTVYPSFIIGLDVMRRCKVDINFSKNILIFYDDNEEDPVRSKMVEVPFIQKERRLHTSAGLPKKQNLAGNFINAGNIGKAKNIKHSKKSNSPKNSRQKLLSLSLHNQQSGNANPFLSQRRSIRSRQYHCLSQSYKSDMKNSSYPNRKNNDDLLFPGYLSSESAKINEAADNYVEDSEDTDDDDEDDQSNDESLGDDGGENTDVSLAGI